MISVRMLQEFCAFRTICVRSSPGGLGHRVPERIVPCGHAQKAEGRVLLGFRHD
jgi:hypothetical protein